MLRKLLLLLQVHRIVPWSGDLCSQRLGHAWIVLDGGAIVRSSSVGSIDAIVSYSVRCVPCFTDPGRCGGSVR